MAKLQATNSNTVRYLLRDIALAIGWHCSSGYQSRSDGVSPTLLSLLATTITSTPVARLLAKRSFYLQNRWRAHRGTSTEGSALNLFVTFFLFTETLFSLKRSKCNVTRNNVGGVAAGPYARLPMT
jgi:hypothetical protein